MWWDKENMPPCHLREDCVAIKGKHCQYTCRHYHTSKETYKISNLPPKAISELILVPENCDLSIYEACDGYKKNIHEHIAKGDGLYLHSNTKGNGKTSWAFKIMKHYLNWCSQNYGIDYKVRGYYVNVSELFDLLRNSFGEKAGTIKEIEKGIYEADLVIFDDIGFEKSTDWVKNKLYNYINYRYQNNKSMLFTSNLSLKELSTQLDDRISDRISEICRPLHFKGQSRRQQDRWWEE
jgi:DNA replication protein DnaC